MLVLTAARRALAAAAALTAAAVIALPAPAQAATPTTITASLTDTVYTRGHAPISTSATVTSSAGTPTGSVTFSYCGPIAYALGCQGQALSPLNTEPLAGGKAGSFGFQVSSNGNWCIVATYNPTPGSAFESSSVGLTGGFRCFLASGFGASASSTQITLPSTSLELGSSLKATATVSSPGGQPTGTVYFVYCAPTTTPVGCRNVIGSLQPFVPLIATTATSPDFRPDRVGWNCLRAEYSGAAQLFTNSVDATTSGCVRVYAQTSMTSTLSAPSIPVGASITQTAKLTSLGGAPDGNVSFSASDGTQLGSKPLAAGSAVSPSYTPAHAGHVCLTAAYAATDFFTAATHETCFDVTPAATTAAVTPSAASIEYGSTVTAQAKVTSAAAGLSGTVSYSVCGPLASATGCAAGGEAVGSATLTGGEATSPTFKPASAGTYCFRADYGGADDFAPASAGTAAGCVTVTPAATTTASAPSRSSIARGESITTLATVTSGSGTPSGTVGFWVCGPLASRAGCADGGTALGSAPLANGSAQSPSFAPDAAGVYCFRAAYPGATSFAESGDGTEAGCFTVGGAASTTKVEAKDAAITYGQTTRAGATVASGAGTPTGTMTFAVCGPLPSADGCAAGGTSLGGANVSDGVATSADFTPAAAGVYCYRAVYTAADAGFVDSSADGGCFDVGQATIHVDASALSKTQGDAGPEPKWTLDAGDFVLGDTAAGSGIAGTPRCQIAAHAEDAGTYDRAVTCDAGSLAAANYVFAPGRAAALTIAARSTPGGGDGGAGGGAGGAGGGDAGGGGSGGATDTPGTAASQLPAGTSGGAGSPGTGPSTSTAPDNRVAITSLRAAKNGTLTLKLRVPGAGRVDVRPSSGKRTAARQRATAKRAGALTVKLTPKGLRKLYARAKGKAITIKLSVVYTPAGGKPRTVTRSVRVGRSHR